MSKPLALMMAGGTGGHVFPALATANKLQQAGYDIHWLGTIKGIESRLVPAANIDITYLKVTGMRGKGFVTLLKAPFLLLSSILQAYKEIGRLQPNVVVGMGGFASGPGAVAAWLRGVPLVIHEQNAVAGTTNRLSAKIATRVLQAFDHAFAGREHKEVVGNPVRDELTEVPAPQLRVRTDDQPLRLLIVGGSLGALALNELVPEAVALMPEASRPKIFHQAGNGKQESTSERYATLKVDAVVEAFIDDMLTAYSNADLVICRAGALTVSELACIGLAAILVPLPHAIDDHQTKNAEWLVENGAAICFKQEQLSAEKLAQQLIMLTADKGKLLAMAESGRACALPDAADRVAKICEEVALG
ncbi:UDP-N-acetylglucosamine-N-acetylmuramylpentapeptide N-acetylglucosamine transferase [Sinobacterium caligoides]|uniref:UDP-N-acetylglucosamine--N-acetylmuramyl-(pentapeptide) pyrophosphoryl-undecaprenol N-acetylglucosamine transferase n=1 Tax=Sinobacterium caligoides TaxID=933926 RepID=A0A3N2D4T0_9GAMM|nr:undecaprenyldiphospho-muramoylpentapeptide beta-N-acetylglucosaminyltransferase [Sinobacterium caligoides]ROR94781.1 UDP-N-acetylglucosamine-N-acetylmuramylpentapeptide N-acetylglucosamine transferase [Sinobacterium caligoides]